MGSASGQLPFTQVGQGLRSFSDFPKALRAAGAFGDPPGSPLREGVRDGRGGGHFLYGPSPALGSRIKALGDELEGEGLQTSVPAALTSASPSLPFPGLPLRVQGSLEGRRDTGEWFEVCPED